MEIQKALLVLFVFWLCNGIDRLMSWQTFARPIVAAPLVGLILGDMRTGIIMGASLESIFMGISAIGGSIPSDPLSSTVVAVSFTIISGTDIEAGLALALPIGTAIQAINSMFTPVLASLAPYWENLAYKGDLRSFRIQVCLSGLFLDRLAYFIVLFLAVAFGIGGLESFLENMPSWVMTGLSASSSMMTAVGLAILTSMIWSKEVGGFFFVGFVLSKYLALDTLAIAILAAVVAIMYFYNEKKLNDLKLSIGAGGSAVNTTSEEDDFF